MMKYIIVISILLICMPVYAGSSYMATDDIYQGIQRELDHIHGRSLDKDEMLDDQAFLDSGWLNGVYETLRLNHDMPLGSGPAICPNGNISVMAMDSIFIAYVDTHPQSRQQPAVEVAIASAMQAYPCRDKK